MKRIILSVGTFLCITIVVLTSTSLHTFAASISTLDVENKGDFVLEPGKQEIFVNPGETVSKYITVTDRIKGDTSFKVQVEDFTGSRDADHPVVILDNQRGPYSSKDYIIPETKQFTLKYGQQIRIPVSIKIPKDAHPGGYYSTVLISNEPSVIGTSTLNTAESNTKIISRIGTLYLIRVNGDVKESGNLEDFRLKGQHQLFYEKGPFTFQILYNNDGNVHLVPYGLITVKNMLGRTVAQLPVDAYFSLPNSLRYRDISWDGKFMFGRYTITLQLNRGYKDVVDTKTISLWVLPWKFLLMFLLGIIVIATLIIYISKNFEFKTRILIILV